MSKLRRFLDDIEPYFERGGKFEKFYGIYEMVDTFIYTPPDVTKGTTHARDGIDLKRTMTYVVIGTFFCILMALYNTGYQANTAMAALGVDTVDNWRGIFLNWIGYNPSNPFSCLLHGAMYFFPIYIVTLAVGGYGKCCSRSCADMR